MSEGPAIVVTMRKPPSTNKLWARGAGGSRHRSAEYSAWLRDAGWDIKRQIVGMEPINCRFNMTVEVPISRRDTDNWMKAIGDVCQHARVVTNDGNLHQITVTPVERNDCMAAFFPLPDMGGVRKEARLKPVGAAWKNRNKPGLSWIK